MIWPVERSERYLPKGTPVEEPDDGDPETLLAVSAIFPASRQAPYEKNRVLDDITFLRRVLDPEHDELVRLIGYAIHREEVEEWAIKNRSLSKNRTEGERYEPDRRWGGFKS